MVQPRRCYRRELLTKAYIALAAVCFFWGTTYLAIRMALESFPPLKLVAARFLLSGSILLVAAWLRGARLPRGRELAMTSFYGCLILGVGNGCLTYAETWIASGLAALMLTVAPFWLVGLEAALPGGERLHRPTVLGLAIGLAGTGLLIAPGWGSGSNQHIWKAFIVLQIGCVAWNIGSIGQRRQPTEAHPVVSGAVQQLATGLAFLGPALVAGEPAVRWSTRGVTALIYLVVFGSIVGYSAYIYALDRLPVAVVSIYNYVNPAVAVALGALVYQEPFGGREAASMGIIFLGIGIVKRFSPKG